MTQHFMTRLTVLVCLVLPSMVPASERPPERFVCAARVDCGAPGLPSMQELPSVATPIVISRSPEAARSKCLVIHASAYRRLARSVDDITPTSILSNARGCNIVSEAFRER